MAAAGAVHQCIADRRRVVGRHPSMPSSLSAWRRVCRGDPGVVLASNSEPGPGTPSRACRPACQCTSPSRAGDPPPAPGGLGDGPRAAARAAIERRRPRRPVTRTLPCQLGTGRLRHWQPYGAHCQWQGTGRGPRPRPDNTSSTQFYCTSSAAAMASLHLRTSCCHGVTFPVAFPRGLSQLQSFSSLAS